MRLSDAIEQFIKTMLTQDEHEVEFVWVEGHNGHPENERCDKLAVMAYNGDDLSIDYNYNE